MENPYAGAPLQVTLCDVTAGKPVRSYMLLGDVPKGVLAAAARGQPRSAAAPPSKAGIWPETRWGAADTAALQRHYGPRWQRLLTPCVRDAFPPGKTPPPARGGAVEPDFGDLDDFDDADLILGEEGAEDSSPAAFAPLPSPDVPPGPAWARVGAPAQARPAWDPATVYSDVAAYPEDTFADLKLKIYAASGVPPYRQHLFYGWGDAEEGEEERAPPGAVPPLPRGQPVRTTYILSVEGVPLPTDVRLLAQGLEGAGGAGTVAGVPVDRRLEERKEDVRVDALDGFRTLREGPGLLTRRVFVADLATLLAPHQEALGRALSDRYQADLLYYGLALKYWPQLSPDAFRLAVSAPNQIPGTFPLLEPSLPRVETRLQLERTLLDRIYAQAKVQARREEGAEARGGVAVTEARVHIEPRGGALSLRNVFDWVATSRAVPAVVARIPPQTAWGSEEPGRRGRDLVVEKRHVSAAAPALAAPLERFLARPPRRPGIAFALLREGGEGGLPPRFVYLTLYADGRYALQGGWREDDRVGFDGVVRQLSAVAGPLVKEVNAMGAAALPLGGRLLTPEEEARGRQGREALGALAAETLTVSTFWPHPLTAAGFQAMKERWRDYERAGIVGIRGLQQGGGYAFYFRKGVTAYNRRAAERAIFLPAARGDPPGGAGTNLYAHLTDPALAVRWDQAFPGRLVRVVHRTADLRVEVVGATLPEFERIRRYVYVFLDGLLHGPRRLAPPRGPPAPPSGEGRLRSLRERDPDLFDLKKYDEGATVYSVLCQGDRQPSALSAEEARALGKKEKEGLVTFWNFSEGRPAFYRCPTKRYPFLSFRAGEHPLGYCLPCCKKTLALPGSRALAVNRLCLAKHRVSAEEAASAGDNPVQARHVLAYGKMVAPGRISWPPPLLSEALFYDTLPPPYVFTLQGVEQHLPALPDAGFFYSLAAVIELEPPQLARELAEAAEALSATYYALAGGRAAFFPSGEDLAAAILATFAPDTAGGAAFSPFGPGGDAEEGWRDLLADLFSIRFDVEVLTFVDAAGTGDVVFHARPRAVARLRGGEGAGADMALLVVSPAGTYPFVAMDHREFLARPWGVSTARRFFSAAYPAEELGDGVVRVLRGMAAEGGGAPPLGGPSLASAFLLAEREGWQVLHKLVNLRDFCYGLLLAPDPRRPDDWAYLPVPYAAHYLGPRRPGGPSAVPAHYGPRPPGRYPPDALARVLLAVGEEAAPTARLLAPDGALVGFIGGGVPRLYYHHDPVPPSASLPPWGAAALPAARLPYPMEEVDRAIYELGGAAEAEPLLPETAALAAQGAFRDNLYPLFVAEFAAVLRGERDEETREELRKLIRKTQFGAPGGLAAFRRGLAAALAGFPADAAALRALAAGIYSREGPERTGKALAAALETTSFGFDRTTLARLRTRGREDRGAAERELRGVMAGRVEVAAGAQDVVLPNIYVACGLPTTLMRPQCDGGRLRVPSATFGSFSEILMSDILNPGKDATLAAMTTGTIDEHRFILRPGERILIRQAP